LAGGWAHLSRTGEVCNRYSEQISDGGLQTHVDTYGHQLEELSASDSKLVDAMRYNQLIGSLMYLVNTRPDICFAVNTLSQYMLEPRSVHWIGAKHVLRYIAGLVDYGLDYVRGDGVRLIGYTDSDWKDVQLRKSPSGCCFGLGSTMVFWFSEKQRSVALSSAEAEYMVASQASCEAI
jgi:hypothetical protein